MKNNKNVKDKQEGNNENEFYQKIFVKVVKSSKPNNVNSISNENSKVTK